MANLRSISRYLEYEIVLAMISLTKCFPSSEKSGLSGKSGTFGKEMVGESAGSAVYQPRFWFRSCVRKCWNPQKTVAAPSDLMLATATSGIYVQNEILSAGGEARSECFAAFGFPVEFWIILARCLHFLFRKWFEMIPSANQLVALGTLPDAPTGSSTFGYIFSMNCALLESVRFL